MPPLLVGSVRLLTACASPARRAHQADFVDFLEALARLATLVQLPDPEMLKRYRCGTVSAFFERVDKGEVHATPTETLPSCAARAAPSL